MLGIAEKEYDKKGFQTLLNLKKCNFKFYDICGLRFAFYHCYSVIVIL